MLDGMLYLRGKGIPYPQLHSGNVINHKGVWCITDVENSLFGLSLFYSELLISPTLEVQAFGRLLFEMLTGLTADKPVVEILRSQAFLESPETELCGIVSAIFSSQQPLSLHEIRHLPPFRRPEAAVPKLRKPSEKRVELMKPVHDSIARGLRENIEKRRHNAPFGTSSKVLERGTPLAEKKGEESPSISPAHETKITKPKEKSPRDKSPRMPGTKKPKKKVRFVIAFHRYLL